ncbi:hypothetical protein QYE76_070185 [Lolium multiflorum]|uniref:CCHC-type domain-containing protein n=1 Tax=Lolium multiflorum TaxID=4521 RepID=A0AAD8SK44_LOLMU|nr:hypothetical protein QYE76_070185 [Lolium multiflorum]
MLSDSRGATTSAARWNGEVDVVFINNRTCDRVRRCCPFVAPEPIVIKIFYALCKRQVNVYRSNKSLIFLESDLQKRFEHHDPHELMNELKAIFETHAAVECYEASKHFFSCMMEEGNSISEHMLAMTGHAKKLSDLGIVIPNRLGINRVLQSLPPSYKNFVMNYNMQNMNKELPELFGMLKAAEIEIKKEHQVLMVNKTTSFKKQGKSKGKFKKGGKKAATPPMKPKNGPKPDAECYYCKEKGHWKRNCSKYLADLKSGLVKKKKEDLDTNSWGSTYIMRAKGRGPATPSTTKVPHPIVAGPLPNPSRPLLLPALSEAPPDFSTTTDTTPSLSDSRGATTSAARWNGRWTSSSSTTERVTEYGGAARSWRRNRS